MIKFVYNVNTLEINCNYLFIAYMYGTCSVYTVDCNYIIIELLCYISMLHLCITYIFLIPIVIIFKCRTILTRISRHIKINIPFESLHA